MPKPDKTYTFYKYFAVYTDNDPVKTSVNEAAIKQRQGSESTGLRSLSEAVTMLNGQRNGNIAM